MNTGRSRWEASLLSGSETNSERDASTSTTNSRRDLIRTGSESINRMSRSRKNKMAMTTFIFICSIGIVIGTGYIYLQHTSVQEAISLNDVEGSFEDVDEDNVPYAEAHSAMFVIPDTNNSTIHIRHNVSTNTSSFDPTISIREFPQNPFPTKDKSPVSLLYRLIKTPPVTFTLTQCPITRPNKFYKGSITIGSGEGVVGYGQNKKAAKKMAAEAALYKLYGFKLSGQAEPDFVALVNRCGEI